MTGADLASILPPVLPWLWTFALRISGDRHDAEDLVQRACVRALERAHQLQGGTTPLSWMFSIVQSTWINELHARNVRSRSGMDWDSGFLATIPDPAARTLEQHVLDGQIVNAVQRLPEAQRVIMLLVGVEGLSYNEAAQVLDVPIGNGLEPSIEGTSGDRRAARVSVMVDSCSLRSGTRTRGGCHSWKLQRPERLASARRVLRHFVLPSLKA